MAPDMSAVVGSSMITARSKEANMKLNLGVRGAPLVNPSMHDPLDTAYAVSSAAFSTSCFSPT
jgi:hypothetical protein